MNAREYLSQVMFLDERMEDKCEEIERLKAIATKVTPVLSEVSVQTSHNDDKIADAIIKIIECQDELFEMIKNFIELKTRIIDEIETLDVQQYRRVLYKRYVQCKKFNDIADEMIIDRTYVRELHHEALKAFSVRYDISM